VKTSAPKVPAWGLDLPDDFVWPEDSPSDFALAADPPKDLPVEEEPQAELDPDGKDSFSTILLYFDTWKFFLIRRFIYKSNPKYRFSRFRISARKNRFNNKSKLHFQYE
jgi:hypothetical protein